MSVRRNLLIILAHGLRADALGGAGAWPLRTPCLEELGQRSLKLIATSASPSDPAGMISLFTGLHARQHGCWADEPRQAIELGWPGLLIEAGYHLAGVGCVGPMRELLDQAVVVQSLDEKVPNKPCAYLTHVQGRGVEGPVLEQRKRRLRYGPFDPLRPALEPDDDIDGFIFARARQMLAAMPAKKPWALIVMPSGPANHLPPPLLYDGLIDRANLEQGFIPADFRSLDALAELDFPRTMLQRLTRRGIAQVRSDYLGRVALIDHGVGRLMSELRERTDIDRTWLVMSSDHGCLLGEHGLVGHRSFIAGAIEVPVMVAPPTPAPLDVTEGLLSTIDVAATIADLAGVDLNPASAGCSLLPIIRGASFHGALGGCVISEFGQRLLLETERHKLIFETQTRQALGLYDMLFDIDERENLLGTPRGSDLFDSLRVRLGDALLPLRGV